MNVLWHLGSDEMLAAQAGKHDYSSSWRKMSLLQKHCLMVALAMRSRAGWVERVLPFGAELRHTGRAVQKFIYLLLGCTCFVQWGSFSVVL